MKFYTPWCDFSRFIVLRLQYQVFFRSQIVISQIYTVYTNRLLFVGKTWKFCRSCSGFSGFWADICLSG